MALTKEEWSAKSGSDLNVRAAKSERRRTGRRRRSNVEKPTTHTRTCHTSPPLPTHVAGSERPSRKQCAGMLGSATDCLTMSHHMIADGVASSHGSSALSADSAMVGALQRSQ